MCWAGVNDGQEAFESFELMLGMATSCKDLHAMERAELGMARSLLALGKLEEASAHLDEQYRLATQMGDAQVNAHHNPAWVCASQCFAWLLAVI